MIWGVHAVVDEDQSSGGIGPCWLIGLHIQGCWRLEGSKILQNASNKIAYNTMLYPGGLLSSLHCLHYSFLKCLVQSKQQVQKIGGNYNWYLLLMGHNRLIQNLWYVSWALQALNVSPKVSHCEFILSWIPKLHIQSSLIFTPTHFITQFYIICLQRQIVSTCLSW